MDVEDGRWSTASGERRLGVNKCERKSAKKEGRKQELAPE
jgi:hypothetical protein